MLLDDLGTFLQTAGAGTVGTTLFLGTLPATPQECSALFEYGGLQSERGQGRALVDKPSVQLVSRGADYATVRARIQAYYLALAGAGFTSSAGRYTVLPAQQPFFLERDANGLVLLAFNCGILVALP